MRMTTATILPILPGLNDYTLVKLLGEGGMGKAFLARCKRTGQTVVVKTIHEHLLGEAKTRQRFQQETDLMRRFRHPNAVAFIQASPAKVEPPFIVMEYVRGITLDELMAKHERLPALRAGKLLAQLCLFLQTAHDNGLLHRDLTPANIMIVEEATSRETVKVMDFGLARRIGFYIPSGQLDSASSTIDGGTPDYICPEQIEGRQVDHRGDLFSVGVLLYGLLTGHVPFEEIKDPMDVMRANVQQQPPRFGHWRVANVPGAVEQLVLSCLAKSPAERPASARALIEAFQLAIGCKLVDDNAFTASAENAVSTLQERQRVDPRSIIDQFEASMVEQMAAIKLRGFVDGVGGKVVESDAGVIKVKLPRILEAAIKKNSWGWFGSKPDSCVEWIALELHMAKKQTGTRSLVEIKVVQPMAMQKQRQFCEQICRELRAYLMVGR
jgi:eukaryotic-like serine/threonine-protein kinase